MKRIANVLIESGEKIYGRIDVNLYRLRCLNKPNPKDPDFYNRQYLNRDFMGLTKDFYDCQGSFGNPRSLFTLPMK